MWSAVVRTTKWHTLASFRVIWAIVRHLTLRPLPSTFWPWRCLMNYMLDTFSIRTNFSTLRLSIPELCVTQSDHITITWNGQCACAVSWNLSAGGKNDPHFWNPWPQYTYTVVYSLCHFQGATTKIKLYYTRKIAFSHCEGYKVNCACAVLRDLCKGVPQNHT